MLRDGRSGGPLIIFSNKIHLSGRNHVSYTRDGIKHVAHFAIAQTLFMYFCHQDLEDALDALVEEHF
jgi:hypothetical protein